MEYASQTWSTIISNTSLSKLEVVQNSALRIATGCTRDTNIQHLHEESKTLPMKEQLNLHASQLRESAQHKGHPLYHLTQTEDPPRQMKRTIFNAETVLPIRTCEQERRRINDNEHLRNKMILHTQIVKDYISKKEPNKILNKKAPEINPEEALLSRKERRKLAQLRTGKCPLLKEYMYNIGKEETPLCILCRENSHNTKHLFECRKIRTDLVVEDLWTKPKETSKLIDIWIERMKGLDSDPHTYRVRDGAN